jgi:hypothetical protein
MRSFKHRKAANASGLEQIVNIGSNLNLPPGALLKTAQLLLGRDTLLNESSGKI